MKWFKGGKKHYFNTSLYSTATSSYFTATSPVEVVLFFSLGNDYISKGQASERNWIMRQTNICERGVIANEGRQEK